MDPISAKLTESALKTVTPLPGSAGGPASGTYGVDQTSFSRVLESSMQGDQASNAKLLELVESMGGVDSGTPSINAISANGIQIDVAKAGEVQGTQASGQNIFDILKEVNGSQLNMDSIMETVMSGSKKFSTQEMIRVQVLGQMNAVYMETISKVGDMAHKSISTPFNMQIS